ncbi:MAG TPA: formate dehydrogenase accessory protein FdhE [Syntrophales bacterium]|nr:formate dehydrogenase accessory protein FdhE [Syntrophales bacterium]HPQ43031.1 formate dehydrogenase accessory protein FdhE [Syntrophales bacterium]
MAELLKDTLKTINCYRNMNPHYEELLNILEEVMILREQYRRKVSGDIFTVDESLIEKKIAGGLPLVDFPDGIFDLDEPREYFIALLEIANTRALEETDEIIQSMNEGTMDYREMVRRSFMYQEDEAESDADSEGVFDLLGFLVEESLRPALEIIATKYGDIIKRSSWSEGYCPICGREPKISELREEEGKRFLFCSQCGFEWQFKRIKCPFCGNEDQQTLAYFTVEDEEKYRVDVCNVCNKYIKAVDSRKTKRKPNLDVEDIATLHLDILADEEGYE